MILASRNSIQRPLGQRVSSRFWARFACSACFDCFDVLNIVWRFGGFGYRFFGGVWFLGYEINMLCMAIASRIMD